MRQLRVERCGPCIVDDKPNSCIESRQTVDVVCHQNDSIQSLNCESPTAAK
jgi:hypothetical protein